MTVTRSAQALGPRGVATATIGDCVSEVLLAYGECLGFFPFCFPSNTRDKVSLAVVNLRRNSQDCR